MSSSFRDRLIQAFPIFSDILEKDKSLIQSFAVTGGAAGELTCTGIKKGDELISVVNLTDLSDITSEFRANTDRGIIRKDDIVDNTGGATTTTDSLLVLWFAWVD